MSALEAAGAAGVRVVELAKRLGTKPVNIHSWFHANTKRYSEIKKIKGGHYRLAGMLRSSGPASAEALPKRGPGRPRGSGNQTGAAKPAGKLGGRSVRRGGLSEQVVAELQQAGPRGVSVREIAEAIGTHPRNIYVWFATSGKKNTRIKKLAPAQYRLA